MHRQRRAGVLLGYANIAVKNLVNLLYTPMLLAYVKQGDYGVFQTANSFVFSLSLLSFGFSGAYVRFYMQRKVRDDDAGIRLLNGMYLLLYLGICLVCVAAGLCCAAHADAIFGKSFLPDEVVLASRVMTVMTFNVALTLFSTVFDAHVVANEEFTFQQTRQMITTLATPLLALGLLQLGAGVVGVAVAQLIVTMTLLILNVIFAVGKLGMRFSFYKFDPELMCALVVFSSWLFANQICDLVNQNVPNVLLGAQCGALVVAVYAVAVQIRNVFVSLSTTLSSVYVPLVNRIVSTTDDNMSLTRLMTRVGRMQMALLCWVYGGFALLGRFFVRRWAGEGFAEAYVLVLAMTLPLCVPLSQNIGIEIQRAKNLHQARSIVYLLMALASVVFTWAFSQKLGCWAAAISYIASIVLGNCLFMNWYYQHRVGLDMGFYWRRVAPVPVFAAIAAAMCWFGTRLIPIANWTTFALWGFAFTVLYVTLLWIFYLDEEERRLMLVRMRSLLDRARSSVAS